MNFLPLYVRGLTRLIREFVAVLSHELGVELLRAYILQVENYSDVLANQLFLELPPDALF